MKKRENSHSNEISLLEIFFTLISDERRQERKKWRERIIMARNYRLYFEFLLFFEESPH